jgi:hypothetical protein
MSTPPPVPSPKQGMPTWLKWLLGLTLGCFGLVIACCLGSCLFVRSVGGDLFSKFQHAEEQSALARASAERVAALDIDFPPRVPADVAAAELTDADVARYVAVRQALQAPAGEYQAIVDRALPQQGGAIGVTRGVLGMLGASLDAGVARGKLLEAAEPALREQSMGPTDLTRLAEIVEWRFLQRPEARFLVLPEEGRREYLQLEMEEKMLAAWTKDGLPPGFRVNDRTREEALEDLRQHRERMDAMLAAAADHARMSPATRNVLEAHRAELEALPPQGLQVLAPLTSEPPFVTFVRSRDGISVTREDRWKHRGHDEPEEASAPVPDEPSEAAPDATAPEGGTPPAP